MTAPITPSEAGRLISSTMLPLLLWVAFLAFVGSIIFVSLFLKWQQQPPPPPLPLPGRGATGTLSARCPPPPPTRQHPAPRSPPSFGSGYPLSYATEFPFPAPPAAATPFSPLRVTRSVPAIPFSPLQPTRSEPARHCAPSTPTPGAGDFLHRHHHFGYTSITKTVSAHSTVSSGECYGVAAPSESTLCAKPLEHVQVLLDWDDTLFPTAFTVLNMRSGVVSSASLRREDQELLQRLLAAVVTLLVGFVRLFGAGNVAIVTNGTAKWVLSESALLYRGLYGPVLALLRRHGIAVISAHDRYKSNKSLAFMEVLSAKRFISQVICVGDARDEYDAVHSVCSVFRSASEGSPRRRAIHYFRCKLIESPSLSAMLSQMESLQKLNFHEICQQRFDRSFEFK